MVVGFRSFYEGEGCVFRDVSKSSANARDVSATQYEIRVVPPRCCGCCYRHFFAASQGDHRNESHVIDRATPCTSSGFAVSLLEFSRSLLLDLLFLFEMHPPAWSKVSRGQELGKDPQSLPLPREIARDPLCELWCILMDTLDGVRGELIEGVTVGTGVGVVSCTVFRKDIVNLSRIAPQPLLFGVLARCTERSSV